MSTESHPDRSGTSSRRRIRQYLWGAIAVVLLLAGLAVYDYIRINLWIARDAGQLEEYPVRLIADGAEVAPSAEDRNAPINRLLIDTMRRGGQRPRNVVTLTRSEIKFNLLRTRAYVKLYLETGLPDNPERRSRLVVLQPLKRTRQGWQPEEPVEKTLE